MDGFEGGAGSMLDPDALTVAAPLIKRSKPAERTLFPVQTLETDLTRQISAS